MESLRGRLLISSGGLYDPNFRHTVVLVGEHNDEGALGVVLNHPLDLTVEEAVPPLAELLNPGERLFQGGPVQPSSPVLLAEFSYPDLADILVFGSVGFLVGEVPADARASIVRARVFAGYAGWGSITIAMPWMMSPRVFAGYAGWGPGQLEGELEIDSWILEPALEEDVFTDVPELLWSRVLRRKGPEYELLSRMPFDPNMN